MESPDGASRIESPWPVAARLAEQRCNRRGINARPISASGQGAAISEVPEIRLREFPRRAVRRGGTNAGRGTLFLCPSHGLNSRETGGAP